MALDAFKAESLIGKMVDLKIAPDIYAQCVGMQSEGDHVVYLIRYVEGEVVTRAFERFEFELSKPGTVKGESREEAEE